MVEDNIPDVLLVGDAVPDDVPHRNAHAAEQAVVHQAVGSGDLDGKIIDKVINGKVDPHDEGPQTKINGNGSCIQKNRVLHVTLVFVQ